MALLSRRTTDTFRELKTQALVLEQNCADLRSGLQKPAPMVLHGGQQLRVLKQIDENVGKVEEDLIAVQRVPLWDVSFEKLLASCNTMYEQIQSKIVTLETKLTDFGYANTTHAKATATSASAVQQGTLNSIYLQKKDLFFISFFFSNGRLFLLHLFFFLLDPSRHADSTPSKLDISGVSSVSTPVALDLSEEGAPDITQDLANLTREIMTPGLLRAIAPSDDDTPTFSPVPGQRAP